MQRVAIIGAGASGLPAIKCCLDEGLEPTCYERTDHIGGLWYYTPEIHEGQACVMKSTVINTSKEMMCYSDFPIPAEFPIFMHHSYVLKYFQLYAEHFKLKDHIKFETEVLSVKPNEDFDSTGKWKLEIKNLNTNETETKVYDAVLVCTGHHADKKMATFCDQEKFKGKIVHSHDYKEPSGYEDKRAVVVGIGNSGGDVAVELSKVCSKTFLSTRRGSWIASRSSERGVPADMAWLKRYLNMMQKIMPPNKLDDAVEAQLNRRFDHAEFGLQPKHRYSQQHVTANDDMPNRLSSGLLVVKPNIKRFTENGVYFEDDTYEDVDIVVMSTGYVFGFPFIGNDVIKVEENKVDLYKYIFPPHLKKQTLAVIGCFQPIGALMPISELQCRLATRVFKGIIQLPDENTMLKDIGDKRKALSMRFVASRRHTMQVDYVPYQEELAAIVGCKPNLVKLFFADFPLFKECLFGPCTPYSYRLQGPNSWLGAREAIMTTWDRTFKPLHTRDIGFKPEVKRKSIFSVFRLFIMIAFVAILIQFLS